MFWSPTDLRLREFNGTWSVIPDARLWFDRRLQLSLPHNLESDAKWELRATKQGGGALEDLREYFRNTSKFRGILERHLQKHVRALAKLVRGSVQATSLKQEILNIEATFNMSRGRGVDKQLEVLDDGLVLPAMVGFSAKEEAERYLFESSDKKSIRYYGPEQFQALLIEEPQLLRPQEEVVHLLREEFECFVVKPERRDQPSPPGFVEAYQPLFGSHLSYESSTHLIRQFVEDDSRRNLIARSYQRTAKRAGIEPKVSGKHKTWKRKTTWARFRSAGRGKTPSGVSPDSQS